MRKMETVPACPDISNIRCHETGISGRSDFSLPNPILIHFNMDSQLKVLTVIFSGHINKEELPAFRGALIEKVGTEHFLFHNHLGDGFRYGYPLIQYKRIEEKPGLICLDIGVDEVHHFFSQSDWSLHLHNGKVLKMGIDHLNLDQHPLSLSPTLNHYQISDWIALNQDNFPEYQRLRTDSDRTAFLEKKLIGNILSYARGVGWEVEGRIKVQLQGKLQTSPVHIKKTQLIGFQTDFTCNICLPPYLGLGGKVSLGNGMVSPIQDRQIRPRIRRFSEGRQTTQLLPI